jgi:hypothetical protein
MTLFSWKDCGTRRSHRDGVRGGSRKAGARGRRVRGLVDRRTAAQNTAAPDRRRRRRAGFIGQESECMSQAGGPGSRLHTPEEIAVMLGGISIKTLNDLVRDRGLETTTVGYAPPSRKGGPRRRIWGMTDAQLEALMAIRKPRGPIEKGD